MKDDAALHLFTPTLKRTVRNGPICTPELSLNGSGSPLPPNGILRTEIAKYPLTKTGCVSQTYRFLAASCYFRDDKTFLMALHVACRDVTMKK